MTSHRLPSWYWGVRIFLVCIPLFLFAWLFAKEFAVTGRLNFVYDFSKDSPFIKRLWPPGRLDAITFDASGDAFQVMRIDPVTFDLRLPRQFERAEITVRYRKPEGQQLRLGVRIDPNEWKWKFFEWLPEGSGTWTEGRAVVEQLPLYTFDRRVQFVLNAPDLLESGNTVMISEIRATVFREPFTVRNVWARGVEYIGRLLDL